MRLPPHPPSQFFWAHSCSYFEDTGKLPEFSPSPLPPSLDTHQQKQEVGTLNWGKGGSDQQCLLPHHQQPPTHPHSCSLLRQLFNWFHLWKGPFMAFKWPSVFIERSKTRDACVKCIIIQCGKIKFVKERPAICILYEYAGGGSRGCL